jgi:hypothetical protein
MMYISNIKHTHSELKIIKIKIRIHIYNTRWLILCVICHLVKAKFLCVLKNYAMEMYGGVDV